MAARRSCLGGLPIVAVRNALANASVTAIDIQIGTLLARELCGRLNRFLLRRVQAARARRPGLAHTPSSLGGEDMLGVLGHCFSEVAYIAFRISFLALHRASADWS